MAKRLQFATEMTRADAGLHADQAGRQVGDASTWPRDHFCRSTISPRFVLPYDVERALADIDADFGAPGQLRLLAGLEHGRTIPLPDIRRKPMAIDLAMAHASPPTTSP